MQDNRLIEMLPTKMVWTMVKRKCREYLDLHGPTSLTIKRKQPFTHAMFHSILTAEPGFASPEERVTFRAFAATLRQTGMRKSELSISSGETFGGRHARRWIPHR